MSRTRRARARGRRQPLGRDAWLNAARAALVEEGTAGVEVNKLAKRLGVSRGGFYWFFRSRQHLLDELLRYWAQSSGALFEGLLERTGRTRRTGRNGSRGAREFQSLVELWVGRSDYDPRWDGAVRDWARTSARVLEAVRRVDAGRIAILERIFHDLGYRGTEAHIRARITYYHQVGYYALGIQEPRRQRLKLLPIYTRVLTGRVG